MCKTDKKTRNYNICFFYDMGKCPMEAEKIEMQKWVNYYWLQRTKQNQIQKIFHSCTNYNCYGTANVPLKPRKLKSKSELIVVGFEEQDETKYKRIPILVL